MGKHGSKHWNEPTSVPEHTEAENSYRSYYFQGGLHYYINLCKHTADAGVEVDVSMN